MSGRDRLWWKHGVVYQVYPRSFMDASGDGVGDLEGIRQRLDHLTWLGVDGIWISPCFPSPGAGFGYDVADYCNVDPLFGRLADMDRLIADAHARGLRIILDLVPNHTSDQHPWFRASRGSRDDPKRDWYVWRDPAPDGGPPNNWLSIFGGPAWEWDEPTGRYYLHSFLKEQPELDWGHAEVEAAFHDVLRRTPALERGSQRCFDAPSEVFAYERVLGSQRVVVALHFGECAVRIDLGPGRVRSGLSTRHGAQLPDAPEAISLGPAEGVALLVDT